MGLLLATSKRSSWRLPFGGHSESYLSMTMNLHAGWQSHRRNMPNSNQICCTQGLKVAWYMLCHSLFLWMMCLGISPSSGTSTMWYICWTWICLTRCWRRSFVFVSSHLLLMQLPWKWWALCKAQLGMCYVNIHYNTMTCIQEGCGIWDLCLGLQGQRRSHAGPIWSLSWWQQPHACWRV